MRKTKRALIFILWILLIIPIYAVQEEKAALQKPRPIETLKDILAWKSIRAATVSNNGQWFAYNLSPTEGDSEVIIRQTKGEKEYRFPIGEAARSFGGISFSEDSRWVGYTVYPTREEAKKLKKQKKKIYNKVELLNLSSGKKIEFDKTRRFAFSRENARWMVLQKYPPESQAKEKEKWSGSDLILYELASSKELNIGNVSEFAFDKKGRWLAWIVDAKDMSGNGIQLRDMNTGVILPVENDKAVYKKLNWTEEGDGLVVLKGKKDENFEDKLFSVVGFSKFSSPSPKKIIYNPKEDEDFPEGMTISPNRAPTWTEDLSGIMFGIHEVKKKEKKEKAKEKEKEKEEIKKAKDKPEKTPDKKKAPSKPEAKKDPDVELPDVVIWHWLDKRLQSQQQVQAGRDKNFNYLCIYHVKEKKFLRLAGHKSPDQDPLWLGKRRCFCASL